MNKKELILKRIDQMKAHFAKDERILCFLGLGSIYDQSRLDEYSDIDFFLIVKDGTKENLVKDVSFLEVEKISYSFKNTKDGYKVIYHDDVYLEFAIFEISECNQISFDPGLVIYHQNGFDLNIIKPTPKEKIDTKINHRINEILTNLYVGLQRHMRGEQANAFIYIQQYAIHHIFYLLAHIYKEEKIDIDSYAIDRRIEKRYPEARTIISKFMQGYDHNIESAFEIITWMEKHFTCEKDIVDRIHSLIVKAKGVLL